MSRVMGSKGSLGLDQSFFYCFSIFLDLESMIIILDFVFFIKNMHHLDIFSTIKKIISPQRCGSQLSNNDRPLSSAHGF